MTYSPKTDWHGIVYREALQVRPKVPYDCALEVDLCFVMPRPASKKKASWHTTRPDWDNLAKCVTDCMTQAQWWVDDSRIFKANIEKRYPVGSEPPGVIAKVYTY